MSFECVNETREEMTHLVEIGSAFGAIYFEIRYTFYGEGTVEEGAISMLRQMFPNVESITITELPPSNRG